MDIATADVVDLLPTPDHRWDVPLIPGKAYVGASAIPYVKSVG